MPLFDRWKQEKDSASDKGTSMIVVVNSILHPFQAMGAESRADQSVEQLLVLS